MSSALERSLNGQFFAHHSVDAANALERLPVEDVVSLFEAQPAGDVAAVCQILAPPTLKDVLCRIDPMWLREAMRNLRPIDLARYLRLMAPADRESHLALMDHGRRADVELLLTAEAGTAGALMDPEINFIRRDQTVGEALKNLRAHRFHHRYVRAQRILLVVDYNGRPEGVVAIQDLALAGHDEPIGAYMQPVPAVVPTNATQDMIVEELLDHGLSSLPVVDTDGQLAGIVRYEELVQIAQEHASTDLQAMFGASRDEKALSAASFAIRKRLPWLQINLLTAFLAAAVVGLFEATIAAYTALAILLPVVAGQSGNTGAQALAVVIRGLALKEISVAHWRRVLYKESLVGALNGIAVATVCALGVYIWSQSFGLVLVIAASMIVSMAIAGMAGASIPILLTRLGQDPAQSSSIILTTVTDVAGFFSFLGIASLVLAHL